MKGKHAILLWLFLLSALILCSCAPATAQLTGQPTVRPTAQAPTVTAGETPITAAIPLVPFSSDHSAIRGVAPEGWTKDYADDFYRGEWPIDLASLRYDFHPGMTTEQVISAVLLPLLGLEEFPACVATLETETFTWALHSVKIVAQDIGDICVDIALTETTSGVYMIGLSARLDDYDVLHEQVFLPALESVDPLTYEERDRLTAATLLTEDYQGEGPVRNVYYTPMGASAPALHRFEGTLTVPAFNMQDSYPPNAQVEDGWRHFPGFSVGFFSYEDYLVPASQSILPSSSEKSRWNIILSPGKVWSEPGDAGMSRASFPFVLVTEDSNETHNGIATFLYDDASVSSFAFQVIQETAAWRRVDFWGQVQMDYTPASLKNGAALAAQFAEELRQQSPIRPMSELAGTYAGPAWNAFNGNVPSLDISATGLILNGIIYLQPCYTRYGEFPYCRYMRHGSFSVSKSMGAAAALLRLAEKYGEQVFGLKIADYVEVSADHDGWAAVTFGDALNMATGIGDNPNGTSFTGEEDGPKFQEFMQARSTQDKLNVCFSYGSYPWGPGVIARYNSINTFVLSAAMDSFLQRQEGPDADIWDMVLEEVYEPIGIHHAPIMRALEADGSRGIPIFGYGLFPTVDDVAKIAALYQNGGNHQGQQLLHAGKLAEALYRTDVVGFSTGDSTEYGSVMYNLSFWAMPYRTANGDFYRIPYMSGFGGNHVALMPNGTTAFRFADAHVYGIEGMVRAAESIVGFPAPEAP